MSSIEEKRVYTENTGETVIYLASEIGVVRVSVSDDQIGDFGIEQQCVTRDLAWVGKLAVATDEDVLLGGDATGFGPAVAVGGDDEPVAAGPEGRVGRYNGNEWGNIGHVDGVRAVDGDLLATSKGLYRVGSDLQHVGLTEANDVSTQGIPIAAAEEGVYRLGNGWMRDLEGKFDRVTGTGSAGELHRACALGEGGKLYVYDGEWREHKTPERFAAVGVGEAFYGVTVDGVLFVDAGDGWRSQVLGVSGVRAMVVR